MPQNGIHAVTQADYIVLTGLARTMASKEPQRRESHAFIGAGQKLHIWGGFSGRSATVDTQLQTFDVFSQTWERPRNLRGSCPDGLYNMAVTSDGERGYTFGGTTLSNGSSDKVYYNTVYQFDPSTLGCKELVPRNPASAPQKTAGSDMVFYDQKLVIYGGRTGSGAATVQNVLCVFDLRTSEQRWSLIRLPAVVQCIGRNKCSVWSMLLVVIIIAILG